VFDLFLFCTGISGPSWRSSVSSWLGPEIPVDTRKSGNSSERQTFVDIYIYIWTIAHDEHVRKVHARWDETNNLELGPNVHVEERGHTNLGFTHSQTYIVK